MKLFPYLGLCICEYMNKISLLDPICISVGWKVSGPLNKQTSQELGMLSTVTLDCHVTKIVMNSGSQL